MTTNQRHGGIDFEAMFDPDIKGDGPAAANYRSNGVPIKFAAIAYGSKGPDVGRRQGGVDLANLWAAAGTARYEQSPLPATIRDEQTGSSSPVTATASFSFLRNGTATWFPTTDTGSGDWTQTGPTAGDAYDIRFTQTAGNATGTLTATLNTWVQVNATQTVTLEYVKTTVGSLTAQRTILVEIRRRSDSVVVESKPVVLQAMAEIS